MASYAKEIAGDVFALMADETFMEKVHAYIREEEARKKEEKEKNDSKKKGAVGVSDTDLGMIPMLMNQTTNPGQLQV